MGIIVIIIILIVLYWQAKSIFHDKANLAKTIIILLIIIGVLSQTIKVVEPGKVKVQVLFGKVQKRILHSGLNFVNPLITMRTMSVRTEAYTMSAARYEGRVRGDDAIKALTSDGIILPMDITCLFHLIADKAPEVYEKIGYDYESKIIRPELKTIIRQVISNFKMEQVYSSARDTIALRMKEEAHKKLFPRGIFIEDVLLRNVTLPKQVETAINAKKTEQQNFEKMLYTLQKEGKEKERKIIEAEGIKIANQTIAEGLTESYLRWYQIDMMKKLIDSPNNTIIFIPMGQEITPIINTGK
ncbi:MAG: prohibitin family protein [Candidatus Cloacimonetes bacterium]|nr:prohibitin family protein [Candidatus Cloacimonadota bacterium]MBL7085558.1 prohibitin family protein [Candidatus Cloacimonadota bacterium]